MSQSLLEKVQSALGHAYTVERELGGGGMSRVFVAADNALGRKIVVKMLPVEMAAGVSVERFKREIQVVARLQHPHIVPVLSAGQIEGLPFYTMPFVKGESLRTRLTRSGEMSVNEAVHLLRDVAAALAYAHGEGVVHRDIKPDNVIVSGGVAVVADFGVAKAVDIAAENSNDQPTGITSLGIALGTPAYMAPEQASADPHVDHRADIYSFGCLAYELVAGTSPFAGRSPQQMLAAHVTETPEPLQKRRPSTPPQLASLVMRCLEKSPGDRPQKADELLMALDAISTTPSGGLPPTTERAVGSRRSRMTLIATTVGVIAALSLAATVWDRNASAKTFTVGSTNPVVVGPDVEMMPSLSPDGKVVAYTSETPAGSRVFLRQIDGGRATMLTGELGGTHAFPRWSPDGSRVSFSSGNAVYVVPALSGGAPRRLIDDAGTHSWSRDGKEIVYATLNQRAIKTYSLEDGSSRTLVEGTFLHSPMLSPDGRVVLYSEGRIPQLTNLSSNILWTRPVDDSVSARISDSTHVNLSPVWAPDGRHILFVSNSGGARDVYQVAVSRAGRPRGRPARITTSLNSYWISLSADGKRMAYDVVRNFSNIFVVPISPAPARIQAARQITRENQHIESVSLSPDGKWLVYDSDRGGNFDIYKLRVDGGEPVQLTTHPASDFSPRFSGSGGEVAFHTTRNGTRDIYIVDADGNGERQVTSGPAHDFSPDISSDGRKLVYYSETEGPNTVNLVTRDASGRWSGAQSLGSHMENIAVANRSAYPRFTPDGASIVVSHGGAVAMARLVDKQMRIIADSNSLGGTVLGLSFARSDPRTVYASAVSAASTAIFAIPIAGGQPRLLLRDEPGARFGRWEFATDGKLLYFTRAAWEGDVWVMDLER